MAVDPPRIMIMDDEKSIVTSQRNMLRRGNRFSVNVASTVTNARNLAESHKFAAASLDIRMTPVGTEGLEIIDMVRKNSPYAYIEAITAFPEYAHAAESRGADRVIHKGDVSSKGYVQRIQHGIEDKVSRTVSTLNKLDKVVTDELLNYSNYRPEMWNALLRTIHLYIDFAVKLTRITQDRFLSETESSASSDAEIARNLLLTSLLSFDRMRSLEMKERNIIRRVIDDISKPAKPLGMVVQAESQEVDLNWNVLQEHLEALMQEHYGEYVAIIDGRIADFDVDIDSLITKFQSSDPDMDILIHRIADIPPVRAMNRGPRVVRPHR